MSAGWAWKCDDCGHINIVPVDDKFGRPVNDMPVGWTRTDRLVKERRDGVYPDYLTRYFCSECSDLRRL